MTVFAKHGDAEQLTTALSGGTANTGAVVSRPSFMITDILAAAKQSRDALMQKTFESDRFVEERRVPPTTQDFDSDPDDFGDDDADENSSNGKSSAKTTQPTTALESIY